MKKIQLILLCCALVTCIKAQRTVSTSCPLNNKANLDVCINNKTIPAPNEVLQLLAKLNDAQKYTGSINLYIPCTTVTTFASVIDKEGNNCLLFPNTAIFKELETTTSASFSVFCHAIAHFYSDKYSEEQIKLKGLEFDNFLTSSQIRVPNEPNNNNFTGMWKATIKEDSFVIWNIHENHKLTTNILYKDEYGKYSVDNKWSIYSDFLTIELNSTKITGKVTWTSKNNFKFTGLADARGKLFDFNRIIEPPLNILGTWKSENKECRFLELKKQNQFVQTNCTQNTEITGKWELDKNVLILGNTPYLLAWKDNNNFTITTIDKGDAHSFIRTNDKKKDKIYTEANLNLEMVLIPGGTFDMGCFTEQENCTEEEKPTHQVFLNDFYIGKYEVTQGLWQTIMGENPSSFKKCSNCPVENVSWNEVQAFLKAINQKTGKFYRLPTEAEWEYAAREMGKKILYGNGKNTADPLEMNYGAKPISKNNYAFRNKTLPVGSLSFPNALELYDMGGNVWEWCSDWYNKDYYSISPINNPQGSATGEYKILRGGAWDAKSTLCRTTYRYGYGSDYKKDNIGFRLCLSSF